MLTRREVLRAGATLLALTALAHLPLTTGADPAALPDLLPMDLGAGATEAERGLAVNIEQLHGWLAGRA